MGTRFFPLLTCGVLLSSGGAFADEKSDPWKLPDEASRWSVSMSVVASNAAIEIVDSEIILPDEIADGDFEVTLSDDLTASSTILSGSVGYRVLPFLELSARAGLASSDSETGLVITGTPTGPFADFFDGPITIDRETNLDVDGYSFGLGATAYVPLTDIGRNKLAAYSSAQYVWNRFEDDTIVSEAATTSLGFVFPINPERRSDWVYRLGGSYNWISRDVERDLILNGESISVSVTQEMENPWAVEFGAGIPIGDRAIVGVGVSQNLGGETSAVASLTYRID